MTNKEKQNYLINFGIDKNHIEEIKNKFYKMAKQKNPNNPTPDYKMCRYGALFLSEILKEKTNDLWYVEGGSTWPPFYKTGGFKTKEGEWKGHYWATNGSIIVDIAAKQFGEEEVIITSRDDSRYESNYTKKELKRDLSFVKDTVKEWKKEALKKKTNRLKR